MKVMVVGSGAREHALIWKLAQEHPFSNLTCVPGNPGIARLARCLPGDVGNPGALCDMAVRESVDLTVVGPEVPLACGIADTFAARGLALFGPSQAAARLESSKAFAKRFMAARNVPTARYELFDQATAALDALRDGRFDFPVVLKADGLAAGKGVIIAPDRPSAERAIQDILVDHRFGDAGGTLVMEEYLDGEEASFFAICDGKTALPLPAAEDHKRVYDDDQGPNTGGMGALAPSPRVSDEIQCRVMQQIVAPVLDGLREEGHPYRGTLYVGLMLTSAGPKVVEFNVRFGDPEAQVVLPMLDGELTPVLAAAANGSLSGHACAVRPEAHVGVVLASGGYPGRFEKGLRIDGLEDVERMSDVLVFHAGTKRDGSAVVTAGGRVLTVVGRGTGFDAAIGRAYEAVRHISFPGMHVRHDIGQKALTFFRAGAGS